MGAADLIGIRASGGLGKAREAPEAPERILKWSILSAKGTPSLQRVLQEVPRDARAKTLRFRVYTFTPPWEGPVRAPWWRQSPSFTWAP